MNISTKGTEIHKTEAKQRGIQNQVKHLRWSFLQKQLIVESCYIFSQKASL